MVIRLVLVYTTFLFRKLDYFCVPFIFLGRDSNVWENWFEIWNVFPLPRYQMFWTQKRILFVTKGKQYNFLIRCMHHNKKCIKCRLISVFIKILFMYEIDLANCFKYRIHDLYIYIYIYISSTLKALYHRTILKVSTLKSRSTKSKGKSIRNIYLSFQVEEIYGALKNLRSIFYHDLLHLHLN